MRVYTALPVPARRRSGRPLNASSLGRTRAARAVQPVRHLVKLGSCRRLALARPPVRSAGVFSKSPDRTSRLARHEHAQRTRRVSYAASEPMRPYLPQIITGVTLSLVAVGILLWAMIPTPAPPPPTNVTWTPPPPSAEELAEAAKSEADAESARQLAEDNAKEAAIEREAVAREKLRAGLAPHLRQRFDALPADASTFEMSKILVLQADFDDDVAAERGDPEQVLADVAAHMEIHGRDFPSDLDVEAWEHFKDGGGAVSVEGFTLPIRDASQAVERIGPGDYLLHTHVYGRRDATSIEQRGVTFRIVYGGELPDGDPIRVTITGQNGVDEHLALPARQNLRRFQ